MMLKKRSIFLTVCASKFHGFIRNLLSPTQYDEKTFEDLSKLVQDHLNPEPSEVIQCYKFHSKVHSHGQSVSEFVTKLQELSEK